MEGTAQVRANEAEAELRNNGLGELVTVRQRNVEEQGFPAEFSGRADAVFLDLPGPWKVQIFTYSTNCRTMLHAKHAPYACYYLPPQKGRTCMSTMCWPVAVRRLFYYSSLCIMAIFCQEALT